MSTKINWPAIGGPLEAWNPMTGCTKISAGCAHCYALDRVLPRMGVGSGVKLYEKRLDEPLHWQEPHTVLVCLLGDPFHDDVADCFLNTMFSVMGVCGLERKRCMRRNCDHDGECHQESLRSQPKHTFMVLTKRPERMREFMSDPDRLEKVCQGFADSGWVWGDLLDDLEWPLPNVWLGVTAENQEMADQRIPILLDMKAHGLVKRIFLSLEPLLGPVDVTPYMGCPDCGRGEFADHSGCTPQPTLDLVIVGGESGPKARPCDLEWIRGIDRQSRAAGVPVWNKQMGSAWAKDERQQPFFRPEGPRSDSKGEDMYHWPLDLRVRQTPEVKQ